MSSQSIELTTEERTLIEQIRARKIGAQTVTSILDATKQFFKTPPVTENANLTEIEKEVINAMRQTNLNPLPLFDLLNWEHSINILSRCANQLTYTYTVFANMQEVDRENMPRIDTDVIYFTSLLSELLNINKLGELATDWTTSELMKWKISEA